MASNRFWAGSSSSEGEPLTDSESSSDNDSDVQKAPVSKRPTYYSSDSGESEKRVVKSKKDRRFEVFQEIVTRIRNHTKINDWKSLNSDFVELNHQLTKSKSLIQKEGIPRIYIKALCMLDACVKETFSDKANLKKMSTSNAKSFNAMRQKMRKANQEHANAIQEYLKDPDVDEDEDDEVLSDGEADSESSSSSSSSSGSESDSDSDSESDKPKKKPAPRGGGGDDDDSDSDSSFWDQPVSDSSSSSSDDEGPVVSSAPTGNRRDRWIKKPGYKSSSDEEERKRPIRKPGAKKEKKKEAADGKLEEKEDKHGFEITEEGIAKRLSEVVAMRGKRGTDAHAQIREIKKLLPVAQNAAQRVAILVALASSHFDVNLNAHSHLPEPLWRTCCALLTEVLSMLNKHPEVLLGGEETTVVDGDILPDVDDENEEDSGTKAVAGNLLAFIERLDDELFKGFQNTEPHSGEYVLFLQNERLLLELSYAIQCYYASKGEESAVARVCSRRLEHLYDKEDSMVTRMREYEEKNGFKHTATVEGLDIQCSLETIRAAITTPLEEPSKPSDLIHVLSRKIIEAGNERSKSRAVLCQIYHHAVHDRWAEARDLMLMSHLQDTIYQADTMTQILYNRTLVQIGLCAFRLGMIDKAHDALAELCGSGRLRELLAQGFAGRYIDKSPEQEKLERRRQIPFHMHISLELIESVHLICAMLLEVPNMAANAYDVKRRVISKTFRRHLDIFDNQTFQGPPEALRDHIVCAARHLMKDDWRQCVKVLENLAMWRYISRAADVKAMLRRRVQVEALRTFIFTYSVGYGSLSLATLAEMFELEEKVVHATVSKMMINDELHAQWDQPTSTIVVQRVEPTRLQYLSMQLAEKAAVLVDNNERLLDCRAGPSYRDERRGGDRGAPMPVYRSGPGGDRDSRRPFREQRQTGNVSWNRRITGGYGNMAMRGGRPKRKGML